MSGKSISTSNSILQLVFNATPWSNMALNATGSVASSLYVSLHTADPGTGGSQTTNETSYTNYARIPVVRTSAGWTVTNNTVTNAALIQFASCGASGATLTYVAVGTGSVGPGLVLWSGPIGASLTVSNAIQPQFVAGSLIITEI